ncbi:MAG: DUF2513 domain-containing protein [Sandarakinorhabdus sp.]|nr:DUF2513 domain-containing protein [Sandarakinorhabdus sp.]
MNVIRLILLAIEEHPEPDIDGYLSVDGVEDGILLHHQHLLMQAGYITAFEARDANSRYGFMLQNATLTWDGHEFIATIRDPEVWRKTMSHAAKVGGWSVSILSELAKGYIKSKASEIGIPMGF